MKRLSFAITLLLCGAVFAQVHIRESVTITVGSAIRVQDVVVPVAKVTPSEISPGDTATIDVVWQNPVEPMLVDEVEAGIISGENYGTLLDCRGDTGIYLYPIDPSDLSQPDSGRAEFWFVADSSIGSDSVMVEIRIGVGVFQWDCALPGGKGPLAQALGQTAPNSQARIISEKGIPSQTAAAGRSGFLSIADTFQFTPYTFVWLTIKGNGGPNLNFPRYSQGDSLWKDSVYDDDVIPKADGSGDSTDAEGDTVCYRIQRKGCALSEIAWVLSAYGYIINPEQLNEWMNSKSYDDGGYNGADVNWKAIYYLSGENLTATETGNNNFGNLDYAHDVSDLDTYLNNSDLVIAQVDNGGDKHWVVVEPKTNGQYPIVDAGYGDRTTMESSNNNVWKYVVVSRKKGK